MILARWQICQSVDELNRENQWAFFKMEGVCGQAFPSFLSPTPLLPPFCSRPIFRAARMTPLREFRSLRTGTLATQARGTGEEGMGKRQGGGGLGCRVGHTVLY